MQLDQGEKGFSFSKEGPLDMRMDPTADVTAADVINTWPEKKLGEIFRDYGEEKKWGFFAKAIVEARRKQKFYTTTQLANFISSIVKGRGKLHPATLIFQGLRIFVNHELESLERGLCKAIEKLAPQGKIGVISFHSLEDRIVKNVFKSASTVTKEQKKQAESVMPVLKLLTKKPLIPTWNEMKKNARARSAKLRFAQKN
ncbi:MAG: 16S rRNA (cytosine(1402)-N(4))-methyltransferase RsmH [Chlamydiae bacterium]|jgi:16S rRNA (cytosine1402-N4)-methyltransferase|nr:16S rRNA (cytosine(1402)-N(4))-methyltransferase RsmH [Chlamydiota bacterium]